MFLLTSTWSFIGVKYDDVETPVVDIIIVEVKDDPSPETLNPRLYIREPNNTKGWWCLLHEQSARERSPRDHCDQCPSPVLGVPPYSTTDPIGYSRVAAVTALGKELYYSKLSFIQENNIFNRV